MSFIERRDIFTILIILLVAFASFGLGRISKIESIQEPVRIEQTVSVVNAKNGSKQAILDVNDKMYVASKNGSKYHYPWCSGAKRISDTNKIWFNSTQSAKKAGYTPAGNCKGLK